MSDTPDLRVTHTPNFNLNLPDVGADWDQWGDQTNANWTFLDGALLPIWGGQMTGLLGLSGDPTTPLGAATRRYVDAVAAQLPGYLPLAGGTMTGPLQVPQGSNVAPSIQLGAVNNGIYAPANGNVGITAAGTSVFSTSSITARFNIPLQLQADPTANLGAATKQYVDAVTVRLGNYLPLDGSAQMTGPLITAPGAGGSNLGIGVGNNTTGFWSSGGNVLVAQTGGATNLILSPNGNQMAVNLSMTTGATLTLAADAAQPMQAVTLRQMGTIVGGPYLPTAGGVMTGGVSFGNAVAPGGITDLSRHIDLNQGTFGFSITSARLNIVVPGGSNLYVNAGGADALQINSTMIRPYVGLSFNAVLAASPTDLSHHIDLYGGSWGMNITSGRIHIVANSVAALDVGSANVQANVPVALPADPTTALQAATKQYVDAAVASVMGRNIAHNGRFRIAQRPGSPYTQPSNYNLDRWILFLNATGGTDTSSITQAVLTDADRSAAQDESAIVGMQNVFVGTAAGNTWQAHRVEDVRSLGGKTVTVSFWAKATVGTPRVAVSAWQWFGSGGSPSAPVGTPIGTTPALTTLLTRYSFSVALPTTIGKIVGNNADDSTEFEFWYSNGANDPRAAGLGQQSGTVTIWGVKIELGSVATRLEPYDAAAAMLQCQRFYRYKSNNILYWQATAAAQAQVTTFEYATMRGRPTVVFSPAYTNASGIQVNGATGNMVDHVNVQAASVGPGPAYVFFDMSLSADL